MSVTLLGRRALAELVGTGGLAVAVIGSGIAAQRLSPGQPGLELLENSLATGIALAVLIAVLQPVSAAFNPLVTLAERVLGQVTTRHALVLIAAQLVGGLAGTMVANLMFSLPAVTVSDHLRGGAGLWLGETVATAGLIMVIFGAVRTGRTRQLGYLVGGYIAAAYWFTSSTSGCARKFIEGPAASGWMLRKAAEEVVAVFYGRRRERSGAPPRRLWSRRTSGRDH
jgi:arsenate reductase